MFIGQTRKAKLMEFIGKIVTAMNTNNSRRKVNVKILFHQIPIANRQTAHTRLEYVLLNTYCVGTITIYNFARCCT